MAVFVCGDTHGSHDIGKLRSFARQHPELTKEDFMIVCGDFGLLWNNEFLTDYYGKETFSIQGHPEDKNWDNEEWTLLSIYERFPWTTLFVDGNHENFDRLALYPITDWHGGCVQKITDSIIHLMRGQVYEINGHTYFCMGGAMSTDRGPATGTQEMDRGKWWWPQEIPSIDEWMVATKNLELHDWEVDFVITHDTPASVTVRLGKDYRISQVSNMLEQLKQDITYTHWFCGHMHRDERYGNVSVLYHLVRNVEDYLDVYNG